MKVAKPHHAARALASGVVAGGVAAALYLIRREQRELAEEAIGPRPVDAASDVPPVPVADAVADPVVETPPVVDDRSVMARVAHMREIAAPAVAPVPEPEGPRRKVRFDWRLAFGILAILAIAVPWFIPGFARSVDERWGSSHSVVDPPVLATPSATATSGATPSASAIQGHLVANGVPIRVAVPRLQIDSAVIPISGASGALFPPNNPAVIGWWKEGPKPGDPAGTTLLTGHTVHTGGGAFDKLDALQAGDTFTVTTGLGTISYQVTGVTNYTKGDLANVASQIFRIDGPPAVLLITCTNWDGHEFLDNTVVTGVPVSVTSPSTPPKVTAGSRSPSPSVRPSRFVQGLLSPSP